ncbi:MAG: YraN family protein, partial [Elusimicrobiaceae bacterium]|nr:YraN family protein [Elusimicrobiaceae bacterium]
MNTTQAGQAAENYVAKFLSDKGYKILARNFSTTEGELDLVCQDKQTLVFVE